MGDVNVEEMLKAERKSTRRRLELEALREKCRMLKAPDQKVLKAIEDELAKLK